jgi:hypothetical protein
LPDVISSKNPKKMVRYPAFGSSYANPLYQLCKPMPGTLQENIDQTFDSADHPAPEEGVFF